MSLEALDELEQRLAGTGPLRFDARVSCGDSVSAQLEGSVELHESGAARLDLEGDVNTVSTRLTSSPDGRQIVVQAKGRQVDVPIPKEFRAVLATGFVRLGLLDLVLRVLSGRVPQSADALRRPLRLDEFAEVVAEPSRPDLSDCVGHAFTVREHGFEVATATLWIDRLYGDPRERSQSLRIPKPLTSTEIYWDIRPV